jgi:curli production assembly/transport component CsgG
MLRVLVTLVALGLAGCTNTEPSDAISTSPTTADTSATNEILRRLPPPENPVAVAVYDFPDQTGQFKFRENVQTLSRAVTQGASSILIGALLDAGDGSWFEVVERNRLDNVLKERQIIREMRVLYGGAANAQGTLLPPMLFAGMLLEGGIISFDSNTVTGGLGARFLGIGASTEYRQDTAVVYLRAISTQSGKVLKSVVVRKTIASVGLRGDVFRFVDVDDLLEIEAGFTTNEPTFLALKAAIEKSVIALVLEGSEGGLWRFANPQEAAPLLARYRDERRASGVLESYIEEYWPDMEANPELASN